MPGKGKPFTPRGVDPEFDKKRDETLRKNREAGIAKKVNRTKLWQDTINKTLAEHPQLGTELINNLIGIMNKTESEKTKLDCIKMLAEMTGIKAPAAAVQEDEQEEKNQDVQSTADRLGELGVEISGIPGTEGGVK